MENHLTPFPRAVQKIGEKGLLCSLFQCAASWPTSHSASLETLNVQKHDAQMSSRYQGSIETGWGSWGAGVGGCKPIG